MTKKNILLFLIFIFFLNSCTALKTSIYDRSYNREFEGFTDEKTFQVVCKGNILESSGLPEFRSKLVNHCKEHLVSTLAKFKVAYEYNSEIIKSKSPAQRNSNIAKGRPGIIIQKKKKKKDDDNNEAEVSIKAFEYDIANKEKLVTDIDQIKTQWSPEQIEEIIKTYSHLLPGQIIREWNNSEQVFIVYQIKKDSLMQLIKNTNLPFGLEFLR